MNYGPYKLLSALYCILTRIVILLSVTVTALFTFAVATCIVLVTKAENKLLKCRERLITPAITKCMPMSVPCGVREVNSVSKWKASSMWLTTGLNGGTIRRLYSQSQLIVAKNGWLFMSPTPPAPAPGKMYTWNCTVSDKYRERQIQQAKFSLWKKRTKRQQQLLVYFTWWK